MSQRIATRFAWSLVALSVPVAVLSLVLGFTRLTPAASLEGFDAGEALQYLTQLSFGVVGALIVSRYPDHLVGWLLCALGLFAVLGLFAYEYAVYGLLTAPETLPAAAALAWLSTWLWVPALGLWALVLLLFPDGALPSRRWRAMVWFSVGATLLGTVPHLLTWRDRGPALLLEGGTARAGAAGAVADVAIPLLLLAVFVSAISLIVRYRRTAGDTRQQLKWLAYAAGLLLALFIGNTGLTLLGAPGWVLSLLFAFAWFGLPLAIAIAMLTYRLYDIDIIINRTLVYGTLTAIVIGLYVALVGGMGLLLETGDNLLVTLAATGLIAVAFAPLQAWLQRSVNRLMYGERGDPHRVLAQLGQRLEAALEPESVLAVIVETVALALKLPYASITLRQEEGFATATTYGTPRGTPHLLPLIYQSEQVGQLILAPRPGEETFTTPDRQLLAELARQAGVAVHAVRLTTELQRSNASLQLARERLVTAQEEERRRLRRDLHDGLGPVLGGLTIKLDIARGLITQNPTKASTLLLDLKIQAQDAVADIRRLVYQLRPPALDELGLVGALEEVAANLGTPAHRVRICIDVPQDLPLLPAAVEVAAYRIAQEALTNVVRHAEAGNCLVRMVADAEQGELIVEISDDGSGLPDTRREGVGLASMRERAAELGGTCLIESLPHGGTRAHARLPYATSHALLATEPRDAGRSPVGV